MTPSTVEKVSAHNHEHCRQPLVRQLNNPDNCAQCGYQMPSGDNCESCGCGDSLHVAFNTEVHLWEIACSLCWKVYRLMPTGEIVFVRDGGNPIEANL